MKSLGLLVFLFLCLASAAFVGATPTEEDVRWVLEQLRNTFRAFRERVQYAAMYLPPPNNPRRMMTYLPRPDFAEEEGVVYPVVPIHDESYQHNFVTASPDFKAHVYGVVMGRHDTIHTEDLFINLVYPRMEQWYSDNFRRNPHDVYLYTHFLPCPNCFDIIQRFSNANPDLRVHVGYTDLYGGNREGTNEERRRASRERRDHLARFLSSAGGILIQLANPNGICGQRGISRQAKRDLTNTCPLATEDREFIITMDFSDGNVKAIFSRIPSIDNNGWIGVFDKNSNRLTWNWTYRMTNGLIKFDQKISRGMYVAYFQENSNNARPVITSLQWDDCGFGHKMLNKIPQAYEKVGLKLTIDNGVLVVQLEAQSADPFNHRDWIAIQTLDQFDTNQYWSWVWVTSMNRDGGFSRSFHLDSPNSDLAQGFRAKYVVYDDYLHRYLWHDLYDNATPLWTPDGCRGTA